MGERYNTNSENGRDGPVTTVYKIRDAEGQLIAEHHRVEKPGGDKECFWKRGDKWGLNGTRLTELPLYGAEQVSTFDRDDLIVLVEGEKARDALDHTDFFFALGTACGAGVTPGPEALEVLRDRRVALWPDNDEAGHRHMEKIAEGLRGVATEVLVYEWDEAPEKGDAADHPAISGGSRKDHDKLLTDLESAPRWRPTAAQNDHRTSGHEPHQANGDNPGLIKRLADAVQAHEHFAQDLGQKLYRFSGGAYRQHAKRFIRRRVKELLEEWGESQRWSSHRANEVVEYIRADAPELWERPPVHEVNVANGILNIEARTIRDHDPAFLSPVQIAVAYDPAAGCPEWDRFVTEVFPEDAQDLAFELVADLITPSRSAQKAILLLGEGSNGKSTYLSALTALVGSTNAAGVSLHKLESDRFAASRLIGKLANICPDLPSTHLTETSAFKAITGGDALHAEYKYQESFEFRPYCRLVFSANQVPRSGDASHAFFRRWLVVPFDRTFTPDEETPREVLDAKLADPSELSGVLNRALDVMGRVRREGFTESESMREAWEEFKTMTDPVSVWLERNTITGANAMVTKGQLLLAYNADCEKQGRSGMTGTAFGLAVKRAMPGIEDAQRTVNGKPRVKVWLGIGLRGGDEDDPGGDGNPGNPGNPVPPFVSDLDSTTGVGMGDGSINNNKENRVNPVTPVTPEQEQRPDDDAGEAF